MKFPIKKLTENYELRQRIIFTLSMILVFRIGAYIPLPGIDSSALKDFFSADSSTGNVLNFFNTFSGGALENLSIFALGVLPYISASIIVQILTSVFPYFEKLSREGDIGRKKITQYTRIGTIVLSVIQGLGISAGISRMQAPNGDPILLPSMDIFFFSAIAIITLSAGTSFVMWIGEQINEKGIGNGISLIIFAGIISSVPDAFVSSYFQLVNGEIGIIEVLVIVLIIIAVIASIVFVETAQRKIPVSFPRKSRGKQILGGQVQHLPLKVNSAGVIPPIFASSILAFPAGLTTVVALPWVQEIGTQLSPGQFLYNFLLVFFIFFFSFFYTAIQFNPLKIAEDLRRNEGYIPGVRPGSQTADYINSILTRLTFGGAGYLSLVCVLPALLYALMNTSFFFGGTALLIVIGVSLDTSNQIELQLMTQNYDEFSRRS